MSIESACLLVVAAALVSFFLRKPRDACEPIWAVVAVHLLFFVVRPLDLTANAETFMHLQESSIIRAVLLGGCVGLVSFYIGYCLPFTQQVARRLPFANDVFILRARAILLFYFVVGAEASWG